MTLVNWFNKNGYLVYSSKKFGIWAILTAATLLLIACAGTSEPEFEFPLVGTPESETSPSLPLTTTPEGTGTPELTTTPEGTAELTTTPEGTATPELTTTPEGTAELTTTPEGTATAEPTTTPESTGTAGQITANVAEDNSLIVNVEGTVDGPCDVQVEYGNGDTGPFVTEPVPAVGDQFEVQVMRLRPETSYDFEVFCSNPAGGQPVLLEEGNFTTGPLTDGLQGAEFDLVHGRPTYDLTLLDFNDEDFNGIVAIDQDARIVWYYEHPLSVFAVTQKDDYNLLFNLNFVFDPSAADNPGDLGMAEITPDGQIVRQIEDVLDDGTACKPYRRWHHEMLIRPDNKVLALGWEARPVEIEGEERLQTGDTIEEWDQNAGAVTRLFSLFDELNPVEDRTGASDAGTDKSFFWAGCNEEFEGEAEDWTHSNSLWEMNDGKILMSIRHLNQIIAIEPDFSGVAWRLGGSGSDFEFPEPSDQFYHQHSAKELPNGNILLFDNGNTRPDEEGGEYSRALELELDFNTMEARKVWEYRHDPELFANCCSNVTRLDNRNTFMIFGSDEVNDPPVFTLVESDPDGNTVAVTEMFSPGKRVQYRAYPLSTINGESNRRSSSIGFQSGGNG